VRSQTVIQEITAVGCLRAWSPATADLTSHPENNKQLGTYLLTPMSTSPTLDTVLPTYLLTPTQVVNFAAHLDDKVEIVGVAQGASSPMTLQDAINAPTQRPEERPSVQGMPRLTVKSLRKISDACPS
jgi:hypothetical protein